MSPVSEILDEIVESKRDEVARRREATPLEELRGRCSEREGGRLREALSGEGVSLMAEIKPRAPSSGRLTDLSAGAVAHVYEEEGVQAVSVLTDEPFFGQGLEALDSVRGILTRPVLRKDFIIDEYQVYETAAAGADALLLIASLLSPGKLEELRARSESLGLDVLVEVHTARELASLESMPPLLGINNRTLEGDFGTDLGVTERLAPQVPRSTVLVSESGITRPEDLARLADVDGVDAVLIGTALLRDAADPGTVRERVRGFLAEAPDSGAPDRG